jgi:hypothetical protein
MPEPDDLSRRDVPEPGRPTAAGRRRGRVLIPVAIVVAIVLVFLFIYLVSRTNA